LFEHSGSASSYLNTVDPAYICAINRSCYVCYNSYHY